MSSGKVIIIHLTAGQTNKISIKQSSYYPEPDSYCRKK